jgi:hypothetical protein
MNQIRETLELGAPIVMFQELRFPKGARGKVKKELKRLNANYECFLEAGIDRLGTESSRDDYGWCSKLNFAVAVFLHREAFNIKQSKRVEWASTQQSKELIRLARGRVQWIDAVTKEGKAMFIVNVHQRVGQDIKLQKVVWEALQDKVTKKEGLPGILGGDLNASIKGGRKGYADRGKQHFEEVDQQLQHYVESMKANIDNSSIQGQRAQRRSGQTRSYHVMDDGSTRRRRHV